MITSKNHTRNERLALVKSQREISIKRKTRIAAGIAIAVGLVTTGIWWLNGVYVTLKFGMPKHAGEFGDMFGGVTALFSGLTIAALLFTIIQQQEDLRIARETLFDSKEEFKQQNRTLRYQKFDNTFFNLLQLHISFAKTGNFVGFIHKYIRTDVFRSLSIFATLSNEYQRHQSPAILATDNMSSISRVAEDEFGQYVRSFIAIVEYIDTEKINENVRRKYFKILVAQLGLFERMFYFYHFHLREEELPPAFKEYKEMMFKPLSASSILIPHHFIPIYDGRN